MTENIEEFLILDSLSLRQLSSCERAQSTFRLVVMGSGIEENRSPFPLIVEQFSLH